MPQRSRESSLYDWLKRGAPAGTLLWRVENSADTGTPDVFGIYRAVEFVIETKVWPKRLTAKQASKLREWSRHGGHAFVVYQKGTERYLIEAACCLPLVRDVVTHQLLIRISINTFSGSAAEFIDAITEA